MNAFNAFDCLNLSRVTLVLPVAEKEMVKCSTTLLFQIPFTDVQADSKIGVNAVSPPCSPPRRDYDRESFTIHVRCEAYGTMIFE